MTATTKRAPGRPKTPLDVAEAQALHRIADLAVNIMQQLRKPNRGMYLSEREIKDWLSNSGIRFTNSDFSPALWLLADTGRLRRAPENSSTGRGGGRGGWITPTVEWSTTTPSAAAETSNNGNG